MIFVLGLLSFSVFANEDTKFYSGFEKMSKDSIDDARNYIKNALKLKSAGQDVAVETKKAYDKISKEWTQKIAKLEKTMTNRNRDIYYRNKKNNREYDSKYKISEDINDMKTEMNKDLSALNQITSDINSMDKTTAAKIYNGFDKALHKLKAKRSSKKTGSSLF